MTKQLRTGLLLSVSLLASACTLLPQKNNAYPPQEPNRDNQQQSTQTAPTKPFEKNTLYDLLVAEIAHKRQRSDIALKNYQKQAHDTRDPQLAERATQFARHLDDQAAILDTSMLWLDIEPGNITARTMAAHQLLRYQQFDAGLKQINILLNNEANINLEPLLQLTHRAEKADLPDIQKQLKHILKQHPNNAQLWVSLATLQNLNHQFPDAIHSVDKALLLQPGYTNAILTKTQILANAGSPTDAQAYLAQQARATPENPVLSVTYARFLVGTKDAQALSNQLETLTQQFPKNEELWFTAVLIAIDGGLIDDAKHYLKQLASKGTRQDEAHIYLARIAIGEGSLVDAIDHLSNVKNGPHYTRSQIQIAALLAKQNKVELAALTLQQARKSAPQDAIKLYIAESEMLLRKSQRQRALDTLNQALDQHADNVDLLYTRAMTLTQLGDFVAMENDLRQILGIDPNNAAALNALGYTFVDRNERLDEALDLIEKAYKLAPNDPAIMDSLGWLKYRLGDTQAALSLLQNAYKDFKDQEIAAHLGEILWVTGKPKEARAIWSDGLKKNPDSPAIKSTMDRLTSR